jgi:hypothetical protein
MCNTIGNISFINYESINDFLQDLKQALQNPSVSIFMKHIYSIKMFK